MPRQYKAADRRRTERFELRLTTEEAHTLVMRSVKARMSIADFVRRSALGPDAYMQKASPEQAALISGLNDLNRIGAALGHIVRSGKYASSPEQTQVLTQALADIKTLSAHLIKNLS